MNEIWKDVKGFEQYYQISNIGNIRSKERTVQRGYGLALIQAKMLHQVPNSRGYLRVVLKANGLHKRVFIHRLVAEHFIPNPNKLDTVNHKDFNPQNNSAKNLEWTTRYENYQYSFERGRFKRTNEWKKQLKKSLDSVMGKPVIGTEISTGRSIKLKALNDSRKYGFQPSCVCNCCEGIRKTHKGYRWKYAQADKGV